MSGKNLPLPGLDLLNYQQVGILKGCFILEGFHLGELTLKDVLPKQ